tara:strand:- start:31 stop:375 length:345 start_codon:yes stop_codon:yes gene_type:complete
MAEENYFKYSPQQRFHTAVGALAPGSTYVSDGGIIQKWNSPDISQPSEEDIQTKVDEYEAIWTTTEYARKRQGDYPDWGAQFNKIYDDGLTKWKTEMVDPIKTKWPKDNSGPVE